MTPQEIINRDFQYEVVNDLWDLVAMNTDSITQSQFYWKYIQHPDSYLDEDTNTIHTPDFDIIVKFKHQ